MTRVLLASLLALAACSSGPAFTVGDVEFAGPPGSGEPHLAEAPGGRAVLTWLEPVGGDRYALEVAVRGPEGWSAPRSIVVSDAFFVNWADFPSLAVLEDGAWVAHWLEKVAPSPYAYHVKLAVSRDEGATWSAPVVPHRDDSPTEHGFVSIVPWNGGAALVWLDGRQMAAGAAGEGRPSGHELMSGAMSVRFTTLGPDGGLGDDVLLDDRACECCQTALAVTAGGLIAAYRDRSEEEVRDIAVVRWTAGRWSDPVRVAPDDWHIAGCPVNGPQLAARGDTVAIAWFTAPEERARVFAAFSTDGGASFGPPIRVDDGTPRGRVDVELLRDGAALVTWLELTELDAEVRARAVRPDGRAGASIVVAATDEARSSGFPRIVRVGDDVLVAWTVVGDSGGVRVAALRGEE